MGLGSYNGNKVHSITYLLSHCPFSFVPVYLVYAYERKELLEAHEEPFEDHVSMESQFTGLYFEEDGGLNFLFLFSF